MRSSRLLATVVALSLLVAVPGWADLEDFQVPTKDSVVDEPSDPLFQPGDCPVGVYKERKLDVNMDIPDDDPNGIVTPPIIFNPQPGVVITDVVIDLCIEHTWVGDLVITLKHTSSSGVVKTADLVNRPGVPETTFGCASDLICDPKNKYYFGSDPSLEPMGEFDCPSEIAPGCYAVAIENPEALTIFRGQPKGDGRWELCINDNAAFFA